MDSDNSIFISPEQLDELRKLIPAEKQQKLNEIIVETKEVEIELSPIEKSKILVINVLADLSGINQARINETDDLGRDLGLSTYHKKSFKKPFQKIVDDFGSSKNILVKECAALKKVKECQDLVISKL